MLKTAKEIRDFQLSMHNNAYTIANDIINKINTFVKTSNSRSTVFIGEEFQNENIVDILSELGFNSKIIPDGYDEYARCGTNGGLFISW